MDTKKFRFVNKTRDNALSQAVTLVDSTFEPLTVLRVMVEGLAHNEATGLWLTRVSDLPSVPRLAPFDIIYLDKNQQVVEVCELLPAARIPLFRKPSVSALILPFQTISSSQTVVGDELQFALVEPVANVEEPTSVVEAPKLAAIPEQFHEAVSEIEGQGTPAVELASPAVSAPPATQPVVSEPAFAQPEVAERAVESLAAQSAPADQAPVQRPEAQPETMSALAVTEVDSKTFAEPPAAVQHQVLRAPQLPAVPELPLEPAVPIESQFEAMANGESAPSFVAEQVPTVELAPPPISASELELTNALNRALASAEKELEASSRFGYLETESDLESESESEPEPEEDYAEASSGLARSSSSKLDAAELLRNSRSRKRRPNRQSLPRARKSRAGLRRAEADKPLFTHKSETAVPGAPELPEEQLWLRTDKNSASPPHFDIAPPEVVVSEPEALEHDETIQQAEPKVSFPEPVLAAPETAFAATEPIASDQVAEPEAAAVFEPSPELEPVTQLDSSVVNAEQAGSAVDNPVEVAHVSAPPQAPVAARPPLDLSRAASSHPSARPESPFDDAEQDGLKSAEPVIGRFLRWLYPAVYQEERRNSVRWPASGLVAYQIRGESLRKLEVRNISSSGIYVLTNERWKPGEIIQLSLQKNGLPEQRVEHRVEIEAGAARYGKDGVGLSFALPAGTNLDLWNRAIQGNANESGAEYIIKEIRMARALGCLRRICAPALHHAQAMLHKEFSNVRVANAIKIILKAENLLNQEFGGDQLIAHPETVVRILELGSWVDTDWIEDLWAGLLATSCTVDGQDCTNLPYVGMLSQFAPIHLRVLGLASAKAGHEGAGNPSSNHDFVTVGELARALDVSNITKILRTIAELSEYGLLTKAIRSPSSPHDASAKTSVTQFGLEMFARCHGLRETIAPAAWHGISTVIVSPAYTEAAGFIEARRS